MKREDLEDAVWNLENVQSSGIDFDAIQSMTTDQLRSMLTTIEPVDNDQAHSVKPERVLKERWSKNSDALELVNGELCSVQTWTSSHGRKKHHVIQCGDRVTYEGRTVSSSIVAHYLKTGEWVKRAPKPVRHQAIVWHEGKALYLGTFDTIEECNAAKVTHWISKPTAQGKHLQFISCKPLTK